MSEALWNPVSYEQDLWDGYISIAWVGTCCGGLVTIGLGTCKGTAPGLTIDIDDAKIWIAYRGRRHSTNTKKNVAIVCNCSSIKFPNSLHSLCQVCRVVCSEIEGGNQENVVWHTNAVYRIWRKESNVHLHCILYVNGFQAWDNLCVWLSCCHCCCSYLRLKKKALRSDGPIKNPSITWGQSCQIKATIVLYSHILLTRGNRIFHLTGGRSGGGERFRTISWRVEECRAGNISSYQAEPINKCNKSLRLESTGRAKSCCCCCLCSCSRSSACMIRCCSWALSKEIRVREDGCPCLPSILTVQLTAQVEFLWN